MVAWVAVEIGAGPYFEGRKASMRHSNMGASLGFCAHAQRRRVKMAAPKKLSPEAELEIIRRRQAGESIQSLARPRFRGLIGSVCNGMANAEGCVAVTGKPFHARATA